MKPFKTLDWIRQIRDAHSKEIANMSKEELMKHYRKNSEKLHESLKNKVGNFT